MRQSSSSSSQPLVSPATDGGETGTDAGSETDGNNIINTAATDTLQFLMDLEDDDDSAKPDTGVGAAGVAATGAGVNHQQSQQLYPRRRKRRPVWVWSFWIFIVASCSAMYGIQFFIINTTHAMDVSMIMDAIAVTTYYRLIFTQPLSIALMGSREPGRRQNFVCTIHHIVKRPRVRIMAYTNLVAFVVMVVTDVWFFLHVSATKLNVITKIVFVVGCITTNIGLALGNAYAALVHICMVVQLLDIAHVLRHMQEQQRENAVTARSGSYDHLSSGDNDDYNNNNNDEEHRRLLPSSSVNHYHHDNNETVISDILPDGYLPSSSVTAATTTTSPTDVIIDPIILGEFHTEMRRRQDALAISFHPRLTCAIFAFSIEVLLMVKAGFQERPDDDYPGGKVTLGALIGLFLGNAYSLFTSTYTMGQVAFISREETGFEVMQLSKSCPEYNMVAQAMTHYPIVFHVGPFEWDTDVSKAFTIFLLSLAGIFVGIQMPELE